MKNKITFLFFYTLFVIVISSVITTACIHYYFPGFGAKPVEIEQETIKSVSDEKTKNSPIAQNNAIVEIFSYGCHFCALNEKNVAALEGSMPAGTKFVRIHLSDEQNTGLARYASLFATLTVMGIEPQHREKAYKAVIREHLNLNDKTQLERWLKQEGIDVDHYDQISHSKEVKLFLEYMAKVSRYYQINTTPTFIVGKKWLAIQNGDFPTFSRQLLSLLQQANGEP